MRRKVAKFLRKIHVIFFINKLLNIFYFVLKKIYKLFGKNPLEAVYSDNFFKEIAEDEKTKKSAGKIAEYIKKNFDGHSVIDVGCGIGIYLKPLEKRNYEVLGVEGSEKALKYAKINKSKILIKDVTKNINLNKKFDVVLCFEVAEHISTKYSETLVKNLTNLGDIILFTAASPGQGGIDHINEQKKEFWIGLFKKNNFKFKKKETEKIKKYLKKENCHWWLYENMMVFR